MESTFHELLIDGHPFRMLPVFRSALNQIVNALRNIRAMIACRRYVCFSFLCFIKLSFLISLFEFVWFQMTFFELLIDWFWDWMLMFCIDAIVMMTSMFQFQLRTHITFNCYPSQFGGRGSCYAAPFKFLVTSQIHFIKNWVDKFLGFFWKHQNADFVRWFLES